MSSTDNTVSNALLDALQGNMLVSHSEGPSWDATLAAVELVRSDEAMLNLHSNASVGYVRHRSLRNKTAQVWAPVMMSPSTSS